MPVASCGRGVDRGAVLLGGRYVCVCALQLCSTQWVWGKSPHCSLPEAAGCGQLQPARPASLTMISGGRSPVAPAKTKVPGPTHRHGRADLPGGTGSSVGLPSKRGCMLPEGLPARSCAWAGLGWEAAAPTLGRGQSRLSRLGGQACWLTLCAPQLVGGMGLESNGSCPQPGPVSLVGQFLVSRAVGSSRSPLLCPLRVQSVSSPEATEPAGEAVLRSALWPSGSGFGGSALNCLL